MNRHIPRAVAIGAALLCSSAFAGSGLVADMPAYQALVQRLFTQDANVRYVKAFFGVKRAKFEPRYGLRPSGSPGP